MRVTATEAKNRFGSLSAQAKREPVFVEKAGQLDTVILSAEHYQALKSEREKSSLAIRKKKFEKEFAGWIGAQNAHCETHGIPGSDLRPW
jgi:PHD/YefM family antitoxin component YafN of YafNO toxin-antitoxin module